MSEQKKGPSGCGVSSGCLLASGGLVFFFFLMMIGIGSGLIELVGNLLFGWMGFLRDVVPKITWDWSAIFTGIACAGLLGLLTNNFLTWLTRRIADARGKSYRWQWKWTTCGLLLLVFCFLVGMSVAGAAHQIGWILGSKESLFVSRFRRDQYIQISVVEQAVRNSLLDMNTLADLRKELPRILNDSNGSRNVSILESVQLLALLSSSNTVNGVLVFPRAKSQRTYNARFLTPNDSIRIAPGDLDGFIRTNAANLVAF